MVRLKPDATKGGFKDLLSGPSRGAQVADAGVAIGFTQLLIGGLHDQGVVEKERRLRPAEQPRQPDLAAGGPEQIASANDEIDPLPPVVDDDGELIGPVAAAIPYQQVAALRHRILRLRTEHSVVELLWLIGGSVEPDAPANA